MEDLARERLTGREFFPLVEQLANLLSAACRSLVRVLSSPRAGRRVPERCLISRDLLILRQSRLSDPATRSVGMPTIPASRLRTARRDAACGWSRFRTPDHRQGSTCRSPSTPAPERTAAWGFCAWSFLHRGTFVPRTPLHARSRGPRAPLRSRGPRRPAPLAWLVRFAWAAVARSAKVAHSLVTASHFRPLSLAPRRGRHPALAGRARCSRDARARACPIRAARGPGRAPGTSRRPTTAARNRS